MNFQKENLSKNMVCGEKWNNKFVSKDCGNRLKSLKRKVRKERLKAKYEKVKFPFKKVKNYVRSFLENRKNKPLKSTKTAMQLPSSSGVLNALKDFEYKETEFDRKYKVKPEDLRPIEEVREETARNMALKREQESLLGETAMERTIGTPPLNGSFEMHI